VPLPDKLARINRRVTNPIVRIFAGRVPTMAVVEHRGRSSGRHYRTPVNAFRADGGFAIALPYGVERDWVKNVLASGRCTLEHLGRRVECTDPQVLFDTDVLGLLPAPVRPILRLLSVSEILTLQAQ
jgi:deazaflavin-dependent oxidoreductase (nitroreductase family)